MKRLGGEDDKKDHKMVYVAGLQLDLMAEKEKVI
jgi:hypothetical protein